MKVNAKYMFQNFLMCLSKVLPRFNNIFFSFSRILNIIYRIDKNAFHAADSSYYVLYILSKASVPSNMFRFNQIKTKKWSNVMI
jgi:hypothetical protein